MSGRAPQKPPRDALRIRTKSDDEDQQIYEWMAVGNGFPFHVPILDEVELYLSRDGRTLYGERFLVRIGRTNDTPPIPSWDYQMTPAGDDLARKRFAYPIVRSLWDYAPDVAERIGLPPRTVWVSIDLGEAIDGECPDCGDGPLVELVGSVSGRTFTVGHVCASCRVGGAE